MSCPVCNNTGKRVPVQVVFVKESREIKCPNPNCIEGRHVVPFDEDHDAVGSPSRLLEHGMERKALCKYCKGQPGGCKKCYHTGFFTDKCLKCNGTGKVWHTVNLQPYQQEGEEEDCPECFKDQSDDFGKIGDFFMKALQDQEKIVLNASVSEGNSVQKEENPES